MNLVYRGIYLKNCPPSSTNLRQQLGDDCTYYRVKHVFAFEEFLWLFMTLNHKILIQIPTPFVFGDQWQVLDCKSLLPGRTITSLELQHSSPPPAGNCCRGPLRAVTHSRLPWNTCTSVTDEGSKLCALNFLEVKSTQLLEGFEISTINCRDFILLLLQWFLLLLLPHSCALSGNKRPVRC